MLQAFQKGLQRFRSLMVDRSDDEPRLRALAMALERVCHANCDLRETSPTLFDATSVQAMSIYGYLMRLHRYTKFDIMCFNIAAWHLGELCRTHPAYCPTLLNIHRLLIAALLVSSKATYDINYASRFLAQVGGIEVSELNQLELELCERLSWKLMPPSTKEIGGLIEAIYDPHASFWDRWYNERGGMKSFRADEVRCVHIKHSSSCSRQSSSLTHSRGATDGGRQVGRGWRAAAAESERLARSEP